MSVQAVKQLLYKTIVRYKLVLYMQPLIEWFRKTFRIYNADKGNYSITDRRGHSWPVCKINDKIYPAFGEKRLRTVCDIGIRKDDIILCGYPKTGCHWVYEIMSMLANGKIEYAKYGKKVGGMLEGSSDLVLDSLPSPRVLNSHFAYDDLPRELKQKKNKIILTVRNPKDTVASYFNHTVNVDGYPGTFSDFFELFMEGELEYGSYFEFYKSWDTHLKNKSQQDVLLVRFEDNKADAVACVHNIATFMGIDITHSFAMRIAESTDFKQMKKQREGDLRGKLFRKGTVGDWRNWLSETESDAIDDLWRTRMQGCTYQPDY